MYPQDMGMKHHTNCLYYTTKCNWGISHGLKLVVFMFLPITHTEMNK